MWGIALRKSGIHDVDPVTWRMTIHPHLLRKVFRSQLAIACPVDFVEMLMGHQGYLKDAHRRYSRKQMAEAYKTAEAQVTVMVPVEYKELKSWVADKLSAHSEIIEGIVRANIGLKDRMASLGAENAQVLEAARLLKRVTEHPQVMNALLAEPADVALERE